MLNSNHPVLVVRPKSKQFRVYQHFPPSVLDVRTSVYIECHSDLTRQPRSIVGTACINTTNPIHAVLYSLIKYMGAAASTPVLPVPQYVCILLDGSEGWNDTASLLG